MASFSDKVIAITELSSFASNFYFIDLLLSFITTPHQTRHFTLWHNGLTGVLFVNRFNFSKPVFGALLNLQSVLCEAPQRSWDNTSADGLWRAPVPLPLDHSSRTQSIVRHNASCTDMRSVF